MMCTYDVYVLFREISSHNFIVFVKRRSLHENIIVLFPKHEYMAYMARKTQKRQTAIVSLNDSNQEELSKIQKQKEEMIAYYEQLKNGEKNENELIYS